MEEETPPVIGGRRRFPDEFSSGSSTEDILIREDENGIRSHYCPLDTELDGRDWNEEYPDRPIHFDFNVEKFINYCGVPSKNIPLLPTSKGSSSESDEESDGSVVGYTFLESEASTSRNSTVSLLTNVEYAPLENEPLTNENSPVSEKILMSRLLQLTEKTSPDAQLDEGTMEAWLNDSSDEFEYDDPFVKLLPDMKSTIEDDSDMEEFEKDSDSENEYDNLKSAKNKEKKDGGNKDKGDRGEGNKGFLADSKSPINNLENESSTESPSNLSKIEHSESKNACKNEQPSNLNAQDENENEKEYPEKNKDGVNKDLSIDVESTENNTENESSIEALRKMSKIQHLEIENASKKEQPLNLNTHDENQNEKEYIKINSDNYSIAIDLNYSDNAEKNYIKSNWCTQNENKNKKERNKSENTNEKEQTTNLNAEYKNQNENILNLRYPENNIENHSTAIDIHLLDNADINGIESTLSTQDDYKDEKKEKESENTNKKEQPINLNAEDENQNQTILNLRYPKNNIESHSTTIDIYLLDDNADRNCLESTLNTQDDYKNKKEEKESENTNKREQPKNMNAEDENQNKKKYPENNIESDSTTIDIPLLDNADRNGIESNLNTQDDYKGKKGEKESENTNKNEQPTNLNAEDENQNEKNYPENNLDNDSTATDMHYLENIDRNGIESNLNTQDENKDKKEGLENDSKNDFFSEDISLPDFDNINGPVSNLSTYLIARLKFRDLLRTLSQLENKDKKGESENGSVNDLISEVIPLQDFDNINGTVPNVNIQDENKDKNIETESDLKDDYIFENTKFRDFVSLKESVSNLNTQNEKNDNKTQAESDLKNDYIFDIITFPDFVSLNGSVSSLSAHDKNEDKKELESDSKKDFISEDMPLTDCDSINEPVSNSTTQDENKGKKEHPKNNLKTDYISEDIDWADFDRVNVPVSNLNTQEENEVKKQHLESNSETGSTKNFLHLADNGQKEKWMSEIKGFSTKMDDNWNELWYDVFPKSQTNSTIKPKSNENMTTLTVGPYERTVSKSIKRDETQPASKRLQRFMSEIYPTIDRNELHFEPSTTREVGDKMPLGEKEIMFDINDGLMLADLHVIDSDGFQPVLTEEQRIASRQPNKLTKFFQSLKKKLERNKKA